MKWPQDFINKVIQGDALEIMRQIPAESIDMAMTSPPYYGLRDYGIENQIGLESHPDEYINKLIIIFRELKRILKKTGSFYLNLGDVYCGSGSTGHDCDRMNDYNGKLSTKIKESSNWLQPKQLMLMPARVAIALQEDGWILRNDIIYHKRNPLPSSVKDRLSNTCEHVYFFVKNCKYFYDLDSIREPHTSIKDLGRKRLDTKTPKHDTALKQKAGKIGPGGYLVQRPLGKNPGDVINFDVIQDLIKEVYARLNRNSSTYKGKNRCKDKNAKVIRVFDGKKIRDTAREILKEKGVYSAELVEYIHDHFSHPLGKNPGDVLTERQDKRAILSRKQGLHTFYTHSRRGIELNNPLGKNPGDVVHTPDVDFVYSFEEYALRLGSNPGDFWTITAKPFRDAHFAVYPEELCMKPIISSCPDFVCKKCGKPVIKKVTGTKGFGDSFNIRVRDMQIHPEKWGCLYKATEEEKKKYNERQYRQKHTRREIIKMCDCNAGFEPGIVLDMFAGSGTTGVVAKKLGRRYILIDLKPEYCRMARKRIAKKFIDIKQKIFNVVNTDNIATKTTGGT